MTDLIDRARAYIQEPWAHQDNWQDLMKVLADEIERLKAEVSIHDRACAATTIRAEAAEKERDELKRNRDITLAYSNERIVAAESRAEALEAKLKRIHEIRNDAMYREGFEELLDQAIEIAKPSSEHP